MASTGRSKTRDRADYLPLEAQHLRQRIAALYREMFCLREEAVQEYNDQGVDAPNGSEDIWDLIEMLPDDIRGYAQRAELRVPIRYPLEATSNLEQLALFEVPGVLDWLLTDGREMPKVKQYLETVDYMRLLTLDYIKRFDHLTVDQKSF